MGGFYPARDQPREHPVHLSHSGEAAKDPGLRAMSDHLEPRK